MENIQVSLRMRPLNQHEKKNKDKNSDWAIATKIFTILKIFEQFWTDTLINILYISYGTSAIFGGT